MKFNDVKQNPKTDPAFTLIELLTVLAVFSALAALLLPTLSKAKTESQRATCVSNLRQVSLAIRMYADDNKDVLPRLGRPSRGSDLVWIAFRPMVQSYLGIHAQASPDDKIFVCPADKFSVEWTTDPPHQGGPIYENTITHAITNFTSYLFNGCNTMRINQPLPGIAGARLGSLQKPSKTVLVAEGSAFEGFSWHKPRKELLLRDSLNEVGYVDGHVDFVKIFWNGSVRSTGAACFYDPPQEYAYTWSGK
jgi:prepilin-type N-terminal cleavage/methylation domain-containing protein